MSVLISGVLMNPAGVPVSGAEVTFSALTNGPSVLNGFSASVMTDQDGNYAIPLEICEYAISIQSDGYNSVYGSVSINEKSAPATINELLKLAAMEQAVTPAIIVYFREIQVDVAAKLAAMQVLGTNAAEAASAAATARDEAAQYAQNLSAAVAQAQQASAAAAASANAASNSANGALVAKNAAETAAGNAQATLANAMLKGQFGWGGRLVQISNVDILDYFKGAVPSGLYQCDSSNVTGLPPGFGPSNIDWRNPSPGFGVMEVTDVTYPSRKHWVVLMNGNWQGWVSDIVSHSSTTRIPSRITEISDPTHSGGDYVIEYGAMSGTAAYCYWDWHMDGNPTTDYNIRFGAAPPASAGGKSDLYIELKDMFLNNDRVVTGGRWGFGGISQNIQSLWDDATWNSYLKDNESQVWRQNAPVNSTASMPPYSTGVSFRSSDTYGALFFPITYNSSEFLTVYGGNTSGSLQTVRKLWDNITMAVQHQSGKGFVLNDIGVTSPKPTTMDEYLYQLSQHQGMGSRTFIDGSWKSHISVRHLGGVPESGDNNNTQYGLAIIDENMLSHNYDIRLYRQRENTWLPPVSLYHSGNATADANGHLKVSSPIVKLFSDGSSELNAESYGVVTTRLSEGVYHITGCLGLNADRAWGGEDGGITNPRCRNGYERIWNDYDVQEDGSLIIRTYHRVHSDAMPFAQNRLNLDHRPYNEKRDSEEWPDRALIDIPLGTYLTVRVQMPAREEAQYVPATRAISHSNVYCNSVSPT
ncbi:prophage tail fiber N-terminal domain-containing protein [Pectobacterium odoriferum]|uniref:phage tail fiber protein n=1 Tax=Pectobacterium odoriferum TaxID=78398 RepID=UPI000A980891|nr:prophage tail fiber N-terminal domain-containing protein [Pectobacterium odoriferum]